MERYDGIVNLVCYPVICTNHFRVDVIAQEHTQRCSYKTSQQYEQFSQLWTATPYYCCASSSFLINGLYLHVVNAALYRANSPTVDTPLCGNHNIAHHHITSGSLFASLSSKPPAVV